MNPYAAIEDHGLIGDLQTAALVSTDGTIDWFCAPRFDSPSIFAALLDQEKGGYFRVAPNGAKYVTKQLYLPGTPILITRFMTADGVGEVVDFMPIAGELATDRHRLVRMFRVVRGQMRFQLECEPRFNYGRDRADVEVSPRRRHLPLARRMTMNINASRHDRRLVREEDIQRTEHGVRAFATLNAGRRRRHAARDVARRSAAGSCPPDEILRLFEQTRDFWRGWIGRSTYRGRWREMVERSAMTLKLMTYAPTGALVAAPTAGLPEQIGGERNWDYRFTWIRDASFSVYALLGLGFTERGAGVPAVAQRPGQGGRRRVGPAADHVPHRRLARPARRRRSTTSRATGAPARSGSATAPPASSSSTSTARRWTRSTSPTRHGLGHVARRVDATSPC